MNKKSSSNQKNTAIIPMFYSNLLAVLFIAMTVSALNCYGLEEVSAPSPAENLTAKEKSCLEGLLGKPDPKNKPDKSKRDEAFKLCEIKYTFDQQESRTIAQLIKQMNSQQTGSSAGEAFDKLRGIWYNTENEASKDRIREALQPLYQAALKTTPANSNSRKSDYKLGEASQK